MSDKDKVEDRMMSALAMTHHIQNRILTCTTRGSVSEGIANDVVRMCASIGDDFMLASEER